MRSISSTWARGPCMHEIEESGQPVQDGAQTLKKDGMQTEASHFASGMQSSHEIEASGQPVQVSPQILKSHSIQKEVKRIVYVLLTSNANKFLILILINFV